MKRLLATATLIAFFISIIPNSYAAIPKAAAKCSKVGATATYAGKKYTCMKSGKKLFWNKGVKVADPKPVATPTSIPTTISDLRATSSSTGTDYTFSYRANFPVLYYELGYAVLSSPNLDPSIDSNYLATTSLKVLNSTNFFLTYQDLLKALKQSNAAVSGQSIIIRVRASTSGGISDWSAGVYSSYSSIDYQLQVGFAAWLNCAMTGGTWSPDTATCTR